MSIKISRNVAIAWLFLLLAQQQAQFASSYMTVSDVRHQPITVVRRATTQQPRCWRTMAGRMVTPKPTTTSSRLMMSETDENEGITTGDSVWNPQLRRIMGSVASIGILETAYLTYAKMNAGADGSISVMCGSTDDGAAVGSCADVLTGPYSTIPFTDIPLATLGLLSYVTVLGLALSPLLTQSSSRATATTDDDASNRMALTGLATTMGTFSIFLMVLLYGILNLSCPYCVLSAGCSVSLAAITWIGNCWPEPERAEKGMSIATGAGGSVVTATLAAVLLYIGGNASTAAGSQDAGSLMATMSGSAATTATTVLASAAAVPPEPKGPQAPPPITTVSSKRALSLAKDLKALDAKMYGAFWCSHCYDQKQALGKQVFAEKYVQYIECSKDGLNSQTKLCKSKEVPGYPTWEINGEFFPGEQDFEELEQIVKEQQTLNKYPSKTI